MIVAATEIRSVDPRAPPMRALIEELDRLQSELYPPESNHLEPVSELAGPAYRCLGAFREHRLLGCIALRIGSGEYGEIKRMFVVPEARGQRIGQRLLEAVETLAMKYELPLLRLETGPLQHAAVELYRQAGYVEIPPFGAYSPDPNSLFMEKRLTNI